MQKEQLRKFYLKKRKALSDDEVFRLSDKICDQFLAFFKPVSGQKIHLFLPIKKLNEVETGKIISFAFKNNIRVFVPKMVQDELISVEIFPDTNFNTHSWGISEPESNEDADTTDFDFVITPLLYCDALGNRVGYGKGFYDGFFENVSVHTQKIGFGFFLPTEKIDNVRAEDFALDYLVTPDEILSFLGGAE